MFEWNDGTELYHYGIKGQKWGIRNYQYEDGSLTPAGKERYGVGDSSNRTSSAKQTKPHSRAKSTAKGQATGGIKLYGFNSYASVRPHTGPTASAGDEDDARELIKEISDSYDYFKDLSEEEFDEVAKDFYSEFKIAKDLGTLTKKDFLNYYQRCMYVVGKVMKNYNGSFVSAVNQELNKENEKLLHLMKTRTALKQGRTSRAYNKVQEY